MFLDKIFSWTKLFWTKCFWTKSFWTKCFWTNDFGQKVFEQNLFWQTVFWARIFPIPNFYDLGLFWTQQILQDGVTEYHYYYHPPTLLRANAWDFVQCPHSSMNIWKIFILGVPPHIVLRCGVAPNYLCMVFPPCLLELLKSCFYCNPLIPPIPLFLKKTLDFA